MDQTKYLQAYELCLHKTKMNIQTLADQPGSGAFAVDGNYFDCTESFDAIGNWTSSFFTGMALLAYETLREPYFLKQTNSAERILAQLCSAAYLDANPECPGVLKQGQVSEGVGKAQTAYTSWGDYFFMEALAKKLFAVKGYW